jgi:response regulator RpfG family c-di-GMP phosphodiesterase
LAGEDRILAWGKSGKIDIIVPDGWLPGSDIPLVARIFAIVDVFDALTSRRPYKEPLTKGEVRVKMMRQKRRTK